MENILITGGTGYFAQKFVERLLKDNTAKRICIFSRDEHKQFVMRRSLNDDHRLRWFIGDVREVDRLTFAMQNIDTVIHTAALKHVYTGEYNPMEMTATNIYGSANIIHAANCTRVKTVIGLSSDKASDPINLYGASKLMMERLFIAANNTNGKDGTTFKVTRYGNVAGSTGSVIPVWRKIKAENGIAPITDPECTRFWMTSDQAVQLVLSAITSKSNLSKPIIPFLPAFRLGDLADAMEMKVKITGLPVSEKKHESMCSEQKSNEVQKMSVEELREALKYV